MTVIDSFQFDFLTPIQILDKVVNLVEETHSENKSLRFLHQFIIPKPSITVVRLKMIFLNPKNKKLRSFENDIYYNTVIVITSLVSYCIMWKFGSTLLDLTWKLFDQTITFEKFFNRAFQWHAVQFLICFFIHRLLSNSALNSFHVSSNFSRKYDLMVQEETERTLTHIVKERVKNELKSMIPQMIKDIINQAGTALITIDDITPEKVQEIQQALMGNFQQIMSQFGLLDSPPVDVSPSSKDTESLYPNTSNNVNQTLLDEEDDYGQSYD